MTSARAALLLTATLAGLAFAAVPVASRPAAPDPSLVARGRYLVEQVGLCSDCHGSHLSGARIDFLAPGLPVSYFAPRIAGLPQLTPRQGIAFFETGLTPSGKRARPPMPQYRFAPDDAVAIVAYLKQLH